jgi:MFS family permease
LILTAMIFAVAMTFIDQTIVSIAAPTIQHALGLSSSGTQWAINAYLLTLAALFAFGGRLADIAGHRRMVVLGVIIFAGASALCGATPRGSAAEAWLVTFRALQGAGGGDHVPGRDRHRGRHLRPALAGPGAGVVLRHRGRPDRDRPDRGRVPDRVDVAIHLLDQHPGRADRAGPDRHLQAAE